MHTSTDPCTHKQPHKHIQMQIQIHIPMHTTLQVGLHQYKLRLIFEIVDMPLSWPADVNAHEAIAYCNWRTRLEKVSIHVEYIQVYTHVCIHSHTFQTNILLCICMYAHIYTYIYTHIYILQTHAAGAPLPPDLRGRAPSDPRRDDLWPVSRQPARLLAQVLGQGHG